MSGRHLGEGAVFDVSFIVIALKEIQVGTHQFLQDHPNITDLVGWDWDENGAPVLFTAYAENGTLKEFLNIDSDVTMGQRRMFALDVACGLHALHTADVAHGDAKLANTLIFPDPRAAGKWVVKVSDFSHSVFGISSRRVTTYPGSLLYNAPESYSFGLLAWGFLKNGEPYFDSGWSRSTLQGSDVTDHQTFLYYLRKDELLELANSFLITHFNKTSKYDYLLFGQIFEMTLRDNANRRKDVQAIAIALDYCDSADIAHFSSSLNVSILSISVWDFNPWDNEPWSSKPQFVKDIESLLAGPLQPHHAELHFLLSRSYTEGYGVPPDIVKAANHTFEAASFDSLEASWIIELCRESLFPTPELTNKRMGSSVITELLRSAVKEAREEALAAKYAVDYVDFVRK
ncbi:kinase-like domain-containing protein [Podospora didyma]|uniref:Kinase-like domain-containing protein n=1 Tax=Podospora didyma TaxID=330526 RepID=A0AAE0NI23_9PEZI|nr:kinase-like domain-containing protein [Podospora didyma]